MSTVKPQDTLEVRVRRIHRRDLNRTWEFLKLVFRDVNRETVEYQRPRSKRRFMEVYTSEWIEQLLYEVDGEIVGYSECAFEATTTGSTRAGSRSGACGRSSWRSSPCTRTTRAGAWAASSWSSSSTWRELSRTPSRSPCSRARHSAASA